MPATSYSGPWLADWPWEMVEKLNEALCAQGKAQFGQTSDGYTQAKSLWETARSAGDLEFADVLELARKAHRAGGFLNYNGNTFAAIVRPMCDRLPVPAMQRATIRQLAGHMVAGVLDYQTQTAFLTALAAGSTLPPPSPSSTRRSSST
jgi:hypothetical protein